MNCWKTINFTKEFGINRLYLLSFLTGLLSFIFLYVPFTVVHSATNINEFGIIPLMLALILLPLAHALLHILPLIMMNNRTKLIYSHKNKIFPIINYYTRKPVSKKVSLLAAFAPTIFITIPGIMATCLIAEYYVYFLIFTSVHIAMTFTDFLYIINISRAPKQSFIENNNNEFAILVKSHH